MTTKILVKTGNLLKVTAGHIVHGCNAQGVMGSGVALGVKNTYPQAYRNYLDEHLNRGLILGRSYAVPINSGLYIWNAITQGDYGMGVRQVSYDAIQTCFEQINDHLASIPESATNVPPAELHIPMIGAARGGGNWEIIREIIEQTVNYPVTLWLPDNTVNTR